ncbi:MAG: HEPN domain-containing protein [Leptospiraceae bacterium]|nr:HEPN domain-containing protein [Leptospiraceae bacterium]
MGNRISKILFQKAEDDLGIAKLAITNQSYLEMANFHLQQAAEKLLKSYLASKEIEFPRTHDLDAIYNLCLPTNIEFKKFENLGELFNEFAVLVRYEDGIEIDLESIEINLKIVEDLKSFIHELLSS